MLSRKPREGSALEPPKLTLESSFTLKQLFNEPPVYDELCFYCSEGARCSNHDNPQLRLQMEQQSHTNIMESLLEEIFDNEIIKKENVNVNMLIAVNNLEEKRRKKPQSDKKSARNVIIKEGTKKNRASMINEDSEVQIQQARAIVLDEHNNDFTTKVVSKDIEQEMEDKRKRTVPVIINENKLKPGKIVEKSFVKDMGKHSTSTPEPAELRASTA
ncbi:unnamed protein product [Thelazia callipaeda]|uniref:Uncharacterized protein n=1 Tax=Thelazia callipaeda TaxID=103827 RepID=A0A0N5DC62_THECL|nr:unnamed protein product [Thelazia callipaeda]